MNMNDPKKRRVIAIVALVVVIAMMATAIIPYLLVQKLKRNEGKWNNKDVEKVCEEEKE